MSGSTHLASFMPRRYEELQAVLHSHGFDIAWNTHPSYPNEWQDDPPLGLVRIKGVWVPEADTHLDGDEDERVTFSMMERWSEDRALYAEVEREGLWLAGYGYNGVIVGPYGDDGRCNHRHDFDPSKPSHLVHHLHPLGARNDIRHPENPLTPEHAIEDFLAVLAQEILDGHFMPTP